MKTLLIKPNAKAQQYGATEPLSAIEMPLWLLLFSNCFASPQILDAEAENATHDQICNRIRNLKPHAVIILATGSHPSAHIQQKEEADRLAMDIKYSGYEGDIQVFDKLIFDPIAVRRPEWDRLPVEKYRAHNWHCWGGKKRSPYGSVFTSVSCPYTCGFCCIKSFYKTKYDVRPVQDVADDIRELYEIYGVQNFKIMDELFVTKSKRMFDLSERLADIGPNLNIWSYARLDTVTPENLAAIRKMGVTWVAYGIESGNEDIRNSNMKGCLDKTKLKDIIQMTKDAGIHIVGNYMFGFWEDSMKTMQETLDLAMYLNTEYANFYCTVAYPGSPFYEEMKARKVDLPKRPSEYAQMSPIFKPIPTKHLTASEVLKFRDAAFYHYFSNPAYQTSLEQVFGPQAKTEVNDMLAIKVERAYT